jgi:pyruvate,orthophosphate dikinase
MSSGKYVYLFEEGKSDMKMLLGGKGANLAEMTRIGLPVPHGFTITTEACNTYLASGETLPDSVLEQTFESLAVLEKRTGKGFGSKNNPLDLQECGQRLLSFFWALGQNHFLYMG